jgi:hypothetical protein
MSVRLSITGTKQLDNVLKMLPRSMDDKFMTQVNTDVSKILVQKMKLTAPEGPTGNLVDSIGTIKKKNAQELGTVWNGPRRNKKGFAGHLVEFGTKTRRTKRGANRGIMPKNNFVERSFDASKAQMQSERNTSIARVLVKTMRRYLK